MYTERVIKRLTGPMPKTMDINVPAMEANCLIHTNFDFATDVSFAFKTVIFSVGTDTVPISRSSSNPSYPAVVDGHHFSRSSTKLLLANAFLMYVLASIAPLHPLAAPIPSSKYTTIFIPLPHQCLTNGLNNLVKM